MENQSNSTEAAQQQEQEKNMASGSQVQSRNSGIDSMLVALNDLRLNDQLTDAVVNCTDGSFPVHRAMLSASSTYFRAQFTGFNMGNETSSTEPQEVFIPGMCSKILKELIDYAYLQKCNINKVNVFEILVSADYIGMTGLITECTRFLEEMLTPDNCLSILKFAKIRFLDALHTSARCYLLRNFPDVFQCNQDILDLNVEDFYEILADDQLNTKDEDIVWHLLLRWIDRDPGNRRQHIAKLLNAVRTGLLTPKCFFDELREHQYVRSCSETRQLILDTFQFMCELDILNPINGELATPSFAMPRLPHELIFAIGGWSGGNAKAIIEAYDTRADKWVKFDVEDPAGPRAYHGTAVIGRKLYMIGGYDGVEYFNTCRVFDAAYKSWKEIAPMHSRRCYVSCAQLNGLIYAIGGYDGHNRMNTVERYDPSTNQWTLITPMHMQRSDASACALNGRIYATGGFNGQECLDSAEFYDPESASWTRLPPMANRRSGVSCVAFRGSVYVIGGYNGTDRLPSGERWDFETQRWHPIRDMHHCRSNFGLEVMDDMIFAIGGFNGVSTIAHTECYRAESDEWMVVSDMNTVRSAVTANTISNLPNVREYVYKARQPSMEGHHAQSANNNNGAVAHNQGPLVPVPVPEQVHFQFEPHEIVGDEEDELMEGYGSPNEDMELEDLDLDEFEDDDEF